MNFTKCVTTFSWVFHFSFIDFLGKSTKLFFLNGECPVVNWNYIKGRNRRRKKIRSRYGFLPRMLGLRILRRPPGEGTLFNFIWVCLAMFEYISLFLVSYFYFLRFLLKYALLTLNSTGWKRGAIIIPDPKATSNKCKNRTFTFQIRFQTWYFKHGITITHRAH